MNERLKSILIWKLIYESYLGLFVLYVYTLVIILYFICFCVSIFDIHPHTLTWMLIHHLSLNSFLFILKWFRNIKYVGANYSLSLFDPWIILLSHVIDLSLDVQCTKVDYYYYNTVQFFSLDFGAFGRYYQITVFIYFKCMYIHHGFNTS